VLSEELGGDLENEGLVLMMQTIFPMPKKDTEEDGAQVYDQPIFEEIGGDLEEEDGLEQSKNLLMPKYDTDDEGIDQETMKTVYHQSLSK
jgi:hypothetical protein